MGSVPFSDSGRLYDGFYGGGHGHGGSRLGPSTSSVLVDGGNTVQPQEVDAAGTESKGQRSGKAAMALKSHSEAERRRRERINAHLATLRTMVPCADKMDKAALLAEVITHVKKLKASAARISKHCPVPADADAVAVELVAPQLDNDASSSSSHGGFLVRATLSCDDGTDLFADVKRALGALTRLRVVGCEVTTLGGRVRLAFLVSCDEAAAAGEDVGVVAESVRQALQSVLDRASSTQEFAPRVSLLSKLRRVSTFESSSSSS